MKQNLKKAFAFSFAIALLAPVSLLAQKDEKEKEKTEMKEKKEKKDVQQIIITRKNEKAEKVVVEINGDKITVNGKPLEEYKDKDGDIHVRTQKFKELEGLAKIPGMGTSWNYNDNGENFRFFTEDDNRAMLGVTTDKADQGVEVQSITKESAAEKAGLKEHDIITKIDDTKIEAPDDLSAAIKKKKPGDKVSVTFLRDKKEQKVTAELTKWKGVNMFSTTPGFKMEMDDMKFEHSMPKMKTMPRVLSPYGQNWSWAGGGGPKLGISVQDTDDGKGVKVIEVDEESNAAKAGIKEEDIITEVDSKAVNNADEIAKVIRESKDKVSVMIKLQRGGKTQNIEVKMPRRLKSADL